MSRFRALDGRMRIDLGSISLINNPATQERILLNHVLQEARILSPQGAMPSMPGAPPMPSVPMAGAAGLAGSGAARLIQLGKSRIEGHEVEGTRYLFPAIPGAPPPSVTSWEMWISTKLKVPVMTKTVGSFGQSTCMCRCTGIAPPPATFQIPPNYKVITPPPPAVPSVPSVSATPPPRPPLNIPGSR